MTSKPRKIGITTTVPQEIIYAAGYIPCDLNNLFITAPSPERLIRKAEIKGFPANCCSWIKGLYTVACEQKIEKIIAVTTGDCSNTQALMEVLIAEGIEVIPFAYPPDRNKETLEKELKKLAYKLGADQTAIAHWKTKFDEIRQSLSLFDELCQSKQFQSLENHLLLVKSSDMDQNPQQFFQEIKKAIQEKQQEEKAGNRLRIGYMGVPPIIPEIYNFIDSLGARVLFNEVQRQFSMPTTTTNLTDQYLQFTYPYDLHSRLIDIKEQVAARKLEGIIHYTQSFCHRQIEDIVVRQKLNIPLLTLDIDHPGKLSGQTKTRIEGFLELIASHRTTK